MADTTAGRIARLEVPGLLLGAILLIVVRLHAFDLPLETDECNYIYIAGRLPAGDRLYLDVWDHQPFGIFALFAAIIAVFGDSPLVFRWLAAAFSLTSLLLIYAIVRRLAGWVAALAAAVLFAVVTADPGTGGEGANREIYMNTLILVAWYCAVRWAGISPSRDRQGAVSSEARYPWLAVAGCCLGLASCIKTIVAIQWLGLAAWVGYVAAAREEDVKRGLRAVLAVCMLAAAPAILWLTAYTYFAVTDRGTEFFDAVFRFNVSYSGGGQRFLDRFLLFFRPPRHPFVFQSALPMWIAGGLAVLILLAQSFRANRRRALLVLAWVVSSYLAVCMPARFWPHYYYLLVPPVVIGIAVAIARLPDLLALPAWRRHLSTDRPVNDRPVNDRPVNGENLSVILDAAKNLQGFEASSSWRCFAALSMTAFGQSLVRVLSAALLIGVIAAVSFTEYRHYLSQPPFGITVKRYNSRDFWGRGQGENVRRVTDPDDRIFVYGNEAEIYYYSGRRCASRYTMITGLAEGMTGAVERREILMRELRTDPPRLILVVFDQPPFDEWVAFLHEFYGEPIGWDYHDKSGEAIMFVLARKDRSVEPMNWNWDRSSVGGWHLGDRPP